MIRKLHHITASQIVLLSLALGSLACGKDKPFDGGNPGNDDPGTVIPAVGDGGYLFAHTGTGSNYYRIFYAISRDGLNWTELKRGESPVSTYYGFPYITRDANGTFWLIGTSGGSA
ncbi:MAG: hypothetical protein J6W82_04650, partial [Bacteroidales bacterium]|nr:hypothetical protein [Bacteroidales bacterium]